MFETVSQGVTYKIRETIYKRVQELDFEFFDETKTGDVMSRMTGDLEAVRHFTSFVIYQLFFNALTFITAMVALFIINFKLTLLLLAVAPVIGFLTYKMAGDVKPVFSAIREQFSKLNSVVQENISGNRVVKAFAREDYEIYKFSRENEAFKDRNLDASKIWTKYLPVLDSMAGVLSVVIILAGGVMVINRSMTLGQLVTFNSFIWALNNPMRMAGWLINDVQRFAACAEKIMSMLQREPKIKDPEGASGKERVLGRVEFRNVGFNYRDCKVLSGISFKALPGQTIAVVGPTGSGKTTLVNLISRFYDCTDGEVLIDDINIRKYDLATLRKNVAVAMQDIFLFSDTIEGNIAYGVPDASVDRVEWAAEVAGAHEFISGFPEGYDTIIGERGVGLSGGQRQRIALARALIKDPSILILDDTTSSVDIETEHEIQKTLKGFYMSKTAFIIAHRISSVKNADLILVLDEGKIVERGTHEELLAHKGYYYNVFVSQYGDFDKDFSCQAG
jgi:ATP-binding cassette subfamily B protein